MASNRFTSYVGSSMAAEHEGRPADNRHLLRTSTRNETVPARMTSRVLAHGGEGGEEIERRSSDCYDEATCLVLQLKGVLHESHHVAALGGVAAPLARGLHSFVFQLNVSALCGIGGAFRGCLGGVQGASGSIKRCVG